MTHSSRWAKKFRRLQLYSNKLSDVMDNLNENGHKYFKLSLYGKENTGKAQSSRSSASRSSESGSSGSSEGRASRGSGSGSSRSSEGGSSGSSEGRSSTSSGIGSSKSSESGSSESSEGRASRGSGSSSTSENKPERESSTSEDIIDEKRSRSQFGWGQYDCKDDNRALPSQGVSVLQYGLSNPRSDCVLNIKPNEFCPIKCYFGLLWHANFIMALDEITENMIAAFINYSKNDGYFIKNLSSHLSSVLNKEVISNEARGRGKKQPESVDSGSSETSSNSGNAQSSSQGSSQSSSSGRTTTQSKKRFTLYTQKWNNNYFYSNNIKRRLSLYANEGSGNDTNNSNSGDSNSEQQEQQQQQQRQQQQQQERIKKFLNDLLEHIQNNIIKKFFNDRMFRTFKAGDKLRKTTEQALNKFFGQIETQRYNIKVEKGIDTLNVVIVCMANIIEKISDVLNKAFEKSINALNNNHKKFMEIFFPNPTINTKDLVKKFIDYTHNIIKNEKDLKLAYLILHYSPNKDADYILLKGLFDNESISIIQKYNEFLGKEFYYEKDDDWIDKILVLLRRSDSEAPKEVEENLKYFHERAIKLENALGINECKNKRILKADLVYCVVITSIVNNNIGGSRLVTYLSRLANMSDDEFKKELIASKDNKLQYSDVELNWLQKSLLFVDDLLRQWHILPAHPPPYMWLGKFLEAGFTCTALKKAYEFKYKQAQKSGDAKKMSKVIEHIKRDILFRQKTKLEYKCLEKLLNKLRS